MLNESGCSLVGQLLFIENNIIHDYAAEEGMSTGITALTKARIQTHTSLLCMDAQTYSHKCEYSCDDKEYCSVHHILSAEIPRSAWSPGSVLVYILHVHVGFIQVLWFSPKNMPAHAQPILI